MKPVHRIIFWSHVLAGVIAGCIIQLGGTPVTEPKKWYDVTKRGYEAPDNPFVEAILKQISTASVARSASTRNFWK